MMREAAAGTVGWWQDEGGARYVAYRGTLSGSNLKLHYGFDGWRERIHEARLESAGPDLIDRSGRRTRPTSRARLRRDRWTALG